MNLILVKFFNRQIVAIIFDDKNNELSILQDKPLIVMEKIKTLDYCLSTIFLFFSSIESTNEYLLDSITYLKGYADYKIKSSEFINHFGLKFHLFYKINLITEVSLLPPVGIETLGGPINFVRKIYRTILETPDKISTLGF